MSEEFQKWWSETIGEKDEHGYYKTSLEDYEKMGIKMTPQQYEKFDAINTCMCSEEFKVIPAHLVLVMLKALDII